MSKLNIDIKYKNIELFIIIIISATILIPQLTTLGVAKLVVPLFLFWVSIIMMKRNTLILNGVFWGLLFLFMFLIINSNVLNSGNFLSDRLVTFIYLFIIFIIAYYYNLPKNRDTVYPVIYWSIFFILLQVILNLIGAHNNPDSLKMLSGSASISETKDYLNEGLAGYGSIYTYSFLGPTFLYLSLKYKGSKISLERSLLFVTGILTTICVYMYTYTIAMVLCTALLLIFLFLLNKKIGIVVLIFTLMYLSVLDTVFTYIINSVDSYSVSERLKSIYNVFYGSGNLSEESSINRLRLYKLSLDTFFNNPISGVGGFYGGSSSVVQKGIGSHSEWIDFVARNGIIGLFLLFIPLISLIKMIFSTLKNVNKSFYAIVIIYVIVLGFINTASSNILIFSLFFIVPFSAYVYRNQNREVV